MLSRSLACAGLLAAAVLAGPATGWASGLAPPACAESSADEVLRLLDGWQDAVARGDAEAIAAFYTADAVLLPALTEAPRIGRDAVRDYFAAFSGRHPQPQLTMRSVVTGCGMATEAGTATYLLAGTRKGTRMIVGGRYTTVLVERDGRWLIAQQSLSLMPRPNRGAPLAR